MFEKVITFFKEVRMELTKVSWPRRSEVWTSTGIVIIVTVLMTFVIWIMDLLFSHLFITLFR
ncbi:MAG: preprotein translocase subunit SecE [Candidatus Stahlbacteria bacterium]|nr:MAG: preprotein translocase subunit SecE [Candidatus Stahlbacteria bacterium]